MLNLVAADAQANGGQLRGLQSHSFFPSWKTKKDKKKKKFNGIYNAFLDITRHGPDAMVFLKHWYVIQH